MLTEIQWWICLLGKGQANGVAQRQRRDWRDSFAISRLLWLAVHTFSGTASVRWRRCWALLTRLGIGSEKGNQLLAYSLVIGANPIKMSGESTLAQLRMGNVRV